MNSDELLPGRSQSVAESAVLQALADAKEHGWMVVSMHNDLKVVFDL
jgi:hypothetical protein